VREDTSFFFDECLDELDPVTAEVISLEEERQARKIILIASESICPRPVRSALASVFTNLYAEGYPHLRMTKYERDMLFDYRRQLAYLRRYSDRRYYKGTDYVDLVEALAQKRVAELFATDRNPSAKVKVPSSSIFANVQSLSGAAANNAVYEAFLEPGDTVLGMSLTHGGHLTHGSKANRSGKRYNVVSYGVNPETGRLDYDAILELAVRFNPKMIIAGYSAYPWSVDWEKFGKIRDAVGRDSILMADIAHPAGLVVAGAYPNPIGYADIITFTTHKTLCGPRGACILTTDEEKARKIDSAVFPGEQGGPHINNIAAKAICFQIAGSAAFKRLQHKIVDNARYLASCLDALGLKLAYGGTDSHMLLVDLRNIRSDEGTSLTAEVATRILDICGIVANKNTIAGDQNAVYPSGVRFGTTWVTQRGITNGQLKRLAEMIHRVLAHIKPFEYIGATCMIGRGKIDLHIMEEVAHEVETLEAELKREITLERRSGYPHYFMARGMTSDNPLSSIYKKLGATLERSNGRMMPIRFQEVEREFDASMREVVLFDRQDAGVLEIYGERALQFLQDVTTKQLFRVGEEGCIHSCVLDSRGNVLDDVILLRMRKDELGDDHFLVITSPQNSEKVKDWFRALSDGYITFDEQDIYRKIEGPVIVVDRRVDVDEDEKFALFSLQGPKARSFINRVLPGLRRVRKGDSSELNVAGVRVRVLHLPFGDESRFEFLIRSRDAHRFFGKFHNLLRKRGLLGGVRARVGKRIRHGFPDYDKRRPTALRFRRRHPDMFDLSKTYFVGRHSLGKGGRSRSVKKVYTYEEQAPSLKRTWLYDEHVKSGGRIVQFAGWEMPVWYTRVSEEHAAVRQGAGLFDVSHMGVLQVTGDHATRFLNLVTTNYVSFLRIGQSQYSYLLYPDGEVVDDIMIFKRGPERYLIVVNAVNEEKVKDWLAAVNSGKYVIDLENRAAEIDAQVTIESLKDRSAKRQMKIDLALQGPSSLSILKDIAKSAELRRKLEKIARNEFIETQLSGIEVMISRTGYTGESIGYELLVHPGDARRLWRLLLESGAKYGIKPAGLGARDSTRIEAGLPLYGHELAGPYHVSPIEAGYGAFVKLHKPFFIGRKMMVEKARRHQMELARFRIFKGGQRLLKQGDPIVSATGEHVGYVTSCALIGTSQQGIGYVKGEYNVEGVSVSIFPLPRRLTREKEKSTLAPGDKVILPIEGCILSRFPQSAGESPTSE